MKALYKTSAIAIGGRDGSVKINNGELELHLSVPRELGGPGKPQSTNPEQLFAAGYAACFESAIRHVARKNKTTILELSVAGSVSLVTAETGFALQVELRPQFTGLTQEVCENLVREAHVVCPYSNAIRNNVQVTTEVNGGSC